MKADQYGTETEQARWRMGWMKPSVRRATQAQRIDDRRCSNCAHVAHREFTNGWGGCGVRTVCTHRMAIGAPGNNGHVTADNALCEKWERKHDEDIAAEIRATVWARIPERRA